MATIRVDLDSSDVDEYSVAIENGEVSGVLVLSLCNLADKIDAEVSALTIVEGLSKSVREWLEAIKEMDEDAFVDFITEEMGLDIQGIKARKENLEYHLGQLGNHLQIAGENDSQIQQDMNEIRWQASHLLKEVERIGSE